MRVGTFACGLVIALAGCGGAAGYSDFIHQQNRIRCDVMIRCCASLPAIYGTTVDSCTTELDSLVSTDRGEDALSKHKSIFDASLAGQCLDALRAELADCDAPVDPSLTPDPCPHVVVGTQLNQSSCNRYIEECVDGQYCLSASPEDIVAPGECQAQSQQGESCAFVTCVAGLGCDSNHVCIVPLAEGQTCVVSSECATLNCVGNVCAALPTVRHVICH